MPGRGGSRPPNANGAGTATLGRQDRADGRADRPEEVRGLRPMRGDSAVALFAYARALLRRDALLTLRGALVWQENEPQVWPAADPRQAARHRPVDARSWTTTWRHRRECVRPPVRGGVAVARAALLSCARPYRDDRRDRLGIGEGGARVSRRSLLVWSTGMMQAAWGVRVVARGTASPSSGARVARPLFAAFARFGTSAAAEVAICHVL